MTKCEGGGASAVRAAVLERDSATEKELAAGANLKWECVCFSSDEYNLFAESPANARIGQCLFIRKPNNYSKQIKIRQLCDFYYTAKRTKVQAFFILFHFFLHLFVCWKSIWRTFECQDSCRKSQESAVTEEPLKLKVNGDANRDYHRQYGRTWLGVLDLCDCMDHNEPHRHPATSSTGSRILSNCAAMWVVMSVHWSVSARTTKSNIESGNVKRTSVGDTVHACEVSDWYRII